jgi:hypothetical protein
MSIVPADSAGDVALQRIVEEQLTDVPAVRPNLAVVEPTTKPVPVTLTAVPPPRGPTLGVTEVTTGATSYVNWSAEDVTEVPPGVVTVMSTVPIDSAGEVAVQRIVDEQLTDVPAVRPNIAVVEPTTKPVPLMLTTVAPPRGPAFGVTEVTTGAAS